MLARSLRAHQQTQHNYERVSTSFPGRGDGEGGDDHRAAALEDEAQEEEWPGGHRCHTAAAHLAASAAASAGFSNAGLTRQEEDSAAAAAAPPPSVAGAFFFMGLLNNASYVIMLASAKSISEGGTALVFLSCVIPSLTLKASAPYWFDRVDYRVRLMLASYLMAFAFLWVALFSSFSAPVSTQESSASSGASATAISAASSSSSAISLRTVGQLIGVAMISLQCGLGEASLLALAGKCDRSSSSADSSDEEANNDESARLAAASVVMTSTGATLEPGSVTDKHKAKTKGRCLTYFSSGTGLSGPFGFLWKMLWTGYFNMSLSWTCCLAAVVLASLYSYIYRSRLEGLRPPHDDNCGDRDNGFGGSGGGGEGKFSAAGHCASALEDHETTAVITSPYHDRLDESIRSRSSSPSTRQRFLASSSNQAPITSALAAAPFSLEGSGHPSSRHSEMRDLEYVPPVSDGWSATTSNGTPAVLAVRHMNRAQRFRRVLDLWPYMVPLFTVYAAEYACQAGAWTAIGFPLQSAAARNRFYFESNWLYQLGVFCSRSSGTLFEVSMPVLWVMPALQVLNLVFFSWAAMHGDGAPYSAAGGTGHWWYDETVFRCMAFYAGLLGGAVYVHGYVRIVKDVDPLHTEFALAATSVAESIGILVADLSGLVLQSCIYQAHEIDGALLTCPF